MRKMFTLVLFLLLKESANAGGGRIKLEYNEKLYISPWIGPILEKDNVDTWSIRLFVNWSLSGGC